MLFMRAMHSWFVPFMSFFLLCTAAKEYDKDRTVSTTTDVRDISLASGAFRDLSHTIREDTDDIEIPAARRVYKVITLTYSITTTNRVSVLPTPTGIHSDHYATLSGTEYISHLDFNLTLFKDIIFQDVTAHRGLYLLVSPCIAVIVYSRSGPHRRVMLLAVVILLCGSILSTPANDQIMPRVLQALTVEPAVTDRNKLEWAKLMYRVALGELVYTTIRVVVLMMCMYLARQTMLPPGQFHIWNPHAFPQHGPQFVALRRGLVVRRFFKSVKTSVVSLWKRFKSSKELRETNRSTLQYGNKLLARYYMNDEYADLTITCHGHIWQVHKLILCGQSEFFKAACKRGFKEGNSNTIDFPASKAKALSALIHYFYHFDYAVTDEKTLQYHMTMYSLADEYLVEDLKVLVASKFRTELAILESSEDFSDVVKFVYDNTMDSDRVLRNIVVDFVVKNKRRLATKGCDLGKLKDEIVDFILERIWTML